MSKVMNPDEFLDLIQQMLDMIRKHDPNPNAAELCDEWEKRLYAWHDVLLRVTAAVQVQYAETGNKHMELSEEDGKAFQDGGILKDEVLAYGNELFKYVTDEDSE